jgi:curved DNA-binding protein CbpA
VTGQTHYDTLGLPPDATAPEIREAFARLIEARWGDGSRSGSGQTEAALRTAYEVLADPRRRAEHDWRLGIDDLQPLDWGGALPEPHPLEGVAAACPSRHQRLLGWLRTVREPRSRR